MGVLVYKWDSQLTIYLRMKDDIKKEFKLLAISNQKKYNEEKRGGDIYGKNSKCICTC